VNRLAFGKLIASLRKEHEDEEDNSWTQEKLAQEANKVIRAEVFTRAIVGSIERGERGLHQQELLAIATALQLTSGERKEFFLAASGIDTERIAREENDPEEVLAQLIDRMKQAYLPAYILDSYCDVVAINAVLVDLMDLASAPFGESSAASRPFSTNSVMASFSAEWEKYYSELMGEDWSDHAYQNMMLFRTWSLRYRSTEYFQALLRELKKSRLFKRYWREVYLDEKDYVGDNRRMRLNSPKWGSLACFRTYLMALSTAGDLHLCVYVPASHETIEVFSRIIEKVGAANLFRVGTWPQKILP
jgi:hypothetical protein